MKAIQNRFMGRYAGDERGAVAIVVAFSLVVFLGCAALAIDVGHLYAVKNELHNAADAGALAGAANLFDAEGDLQVSFARGQAIKIVRQNKAGGQFVRKVAVDIGHWSFLETDASRKFTPSTNTTQMDNWEIVAFDKLDQGYPEFINAVRVTTWRPDTPSYLAHLFGFDKFFVQAQSVAYIGFPEGLWPQEVDEPIAICEDSVTEQSDGSFQCSAGRMITSNENLFWTDFTQSDDIVNVCQGGASQGTIASAINRINGCDGGNSNPLVFGEDMALNSGQIQTAFDDLVYCWNQETSMTMPWKLVLPVVDCSGSTCSKLVTAVIVDVLWITRTDNVDPGAPYIMDDWTSSASNGADRWASFVNHFNLIDGNGQPLAYKKKTIYFKPTCDIVESRSAPIGKNYGVLAKTPKIVQ